MASGRTSRVCIIGGGAAGLAILKVLRETDEYKTGLWELVVFEARSEIGGVWLPSPPLGNPPASPLYDALTTNLPHPVMAFSSFWFAPSTPLFPRADAVLTYLQAYAAHFALAPHIRLNTRVDAAVWDASTRAWDVRVSDGTTQRFDRLVVANGHYGVPRYPTIPGVQAWLDAGQASHSVFYRNAQAYRGKTVLVVGNGPSGQDVTAEVATVANTVYHSITGAVPEDIGNLKRRGRVRAFESGRVVFEDGTVAAGIDHAILATGYMMSIPFLPQLPTGALPLVPPLPSHALNTTYSVFPLALHIFPLQYEFPADAIAFVGLLIRVAPFPIFEAQGRYIASVFARPGSLDVAVEAQRVLVRYERLRVQWGDDATVLARQWHVCPDAEQFAYRRELLDLAAAGREWYPEDWVEETYAAKGELRRAWVGLEREGRAEEWVQGVGEGGRHEWVTMMWRLLEASKEK